MRGDRKRVNTFLDNQQITQLDEIVSFMREQNSSQKIDRAKLIRQFIDEGIAKNKKKNIL
ncbi:hypothetical protein [Cytobacillus oceanisediminis]|uniref:hypothetical protein n=1 Tax=Cytobacillus oceanisediminis TaxID=665099 RepID=UPI000FB8DC85|nr:hypothetical protein [Cytobacillus oceanisediminis]MDK7667384.1 hypothetical protein [Cytobacillus oceanisediminis]